VLIPAPPPEFNPVAGEAPATAREGACASPNWKLDIRFIL